MRTIDADELGFELKISPNGYLYVTDDDIISAPTIDAVPVVHGRWEVIKESDELDPRMSCSVCREIDMPLARWVYCPNCGAKMDLEDEE